MHEAYSQKGLLKSKPFFIALNSNKIQDVKDRYSKIREVVRGIS